MREDTPGDTCTERSRSKRLVAYLVPALHRQTLPQQVSQWQSEYVSDWQTLYEQLYSQNQTTDDLTFNIAGWNSSYTKLPIPDREMQEWVESTVSRIKANFPQRVLEIGCGTGLLLSRLAKHCQQYWGTDYSIAAIQHVEQVCSTVEGLTHVRLLHKKADNFDGIPQGNFDTIVLNSIIQYFPSVEYLLQVIEGAMSTTGYANAAITQQGTIFVGDVRSLPLLEQYHAAVQLSQAAVDRTIEQWQLYNAYSQGQLTPLTPLPIQYADFALWERDWLQGDVLQSQLDYWQKQLAGASTLLALPTDRPRPAVQTFAGTYQKFALSIELTEKLKKLSQEQGCTLFMTLLAAFDTLLYRYTGQEDILVGSPIANRDHSELEGLIGFFVNTLVWRTNVSGNPSFSELLARVREMAIDAYTHQDLPFEMLVEALQPERDLSHAPLFQVMFVLENESKSQLELAELTVSPLVVESATAKFDLTLAMENTPTGLAGAWEYNTDLFDASTIERLTGHFVTLLEGIVANPTEPISQLPLLTEVEQRQLLVEWNHTQADYPSDKCIHQLFEEQYLSTPDAVAVVFEGEQLTYQQLNTRANQLAHYLRSLGVRADVLVGICINRSIEMVVGLLGILKAGGAYVPLDPDYPTERLRFMLEDAQAPVLLTQQHLVGKLPEHKAHIVYLDTDGYQLDQASEIPNISEVKASNLAYVLYTSGSTGRPKAVAIEHHSPVALVSWAKEVFRKEELAGVLASTSICFDLSVFELFVTLCVGGKVILAENALHLSTMSAANQVTLIKVESMGDIIPRTSQLNLGVRLSPHPASDVLSLRLCSCACNRGNSHELLQDYYFFQLA